MWRETNVLGVYMSPLIAYLVAALIGSVVLRAALVRFGLLRWMWNPPLAETGLYVCILALLIVFV